MTLLTDITKAVEKCEGKNVENNLRDSKNVRKWTIRNIKRNKSAKEKSTKTEFYKKGKTSIRNSSQFFYLSLQEIEFNLFGSSYILIRLNANEQKKDDQEKYNRAHSQIHTYYALLLIYRTRKSNVISYKNTFNVLT